jgi:hypothetical protein
MLARPGAEMEPTKVTPSPITRLLFWALNSDMEFLDFELTGDYQGFILALLTDWMIQVLPVSVDPSYARLRCNHPSRLNF